ncbi:MAG: AMP-binding protein [Solirubrobacterales bacterium]|nr:AMP-binding protein [Solirubrobacterales bacterium]
MLETPTDWLDHSARVHPDRLAVADREESLTYSELLTRAGRMAATLAEQGIGSGDPVAIDLPAGVGHAVALHGAIIAGAVPQSMPPTGRKGVPVAPGAGFVDPDTLERASRSREGWPTIRRSPREPLTRVLSSGTSGEPKAVELTSANHLWSALASGMNLGVEPDDRWLCCLPLNHVGALTILLRSAVYGTAAIIHDGFDTDRVAAALAAGEASVVSLVPTQLVRLLDAGAAVDAPRLLLLGGGPVSAAVLDEALGRGATVVQTYGLTEACSQVCTLAPAEARDRAGSAGKPLLGVEVSIESEEILVRGPNVAPGQVAADGWLHTGDLGRIDDEGYLWVEGRRSDLIISGGENVRPERVEEVLRGGPGVEDVAVSGVADREWGQIVVAYVVPAPDAELDPDSLLDHARSVLSRHEVPKRVELVGKLPRTASGKLQRRLLGAGEGGESLYAGAPPATAHEPPEESR